MTNHLTVQVTEDWRRDGLRLVPYRHGEGATYVAQVSEPMEGVTPYLRLMPVLDSEPYDRDREMEAGITIQVELARAIYEALGRHFGDHQDPASRELVDTLKDTVNTESARVDRLLEYVTAPPVPPFIVNGGTINTPTPVVDHG